MKRHRPIGNWFQGYLPGKRKISLKHALLLSDQASIRCALAKLDVECAVARMTMKNKVTDYELS